MTHTYSLSGLTCMNCVAKVKSALMKNPDITSVELTLDPPQALISMRRHIPVERLQEFVATAGNYTISETAQHTPDPSQEGKVGLSQEGKNGSWFKTYKPIVLIFAFITGVSLFAAYDHGIIHAMMFMSTFMAGFFLVFSFFKFLDLKSFANSYAMYDLLAMRLPVYGFIYPFIELGLGLAYLIRFNPFVTGLTTLIIMGFSSVGVIQSVLSKKKIRCACLGAVFNFPMSSVTIVEDLLMVSMAAAMLIYSNR